MLPLLWGGIVIFLRKVAHPYHRGNCNHSIKQAFEFRIEVNKKTYGDLTFPRLLRGCKSVLCSPPSSLKMSFADVSRFFSPEKGKSPDLTLDQLPCTAQCLRLVVVGMFAQIHPSETRQQQRERL